MHHSVFKAISILRYSGNTVSRYDTQLLYQYAAILIDPYFLSTLMVLFLKVASTENYALAVQANIIHLLDT